MKCPVCGNPVAPTDEFCENCGAELKPAKAAAAAGKNKKHPAVAVANANAPKICPNCQFANDPKDEFCENCGSALPASGAVVVAAATKSSTANVSTAQVATSAVMPSAQLDIKCPRCGSPISINDKFCRKCGFNFVTSGLNTSRPTAQVEVVPQTIDHKLSIDVGSRVGPDGKYELRKLVGKGGMGAVFLAFDRVLKREVVIKALLSSDDPDEVEAAVREREFLAAIKHPNIVGIYDFVSIGTEGYIVMEYVPGHTLFQLMESSNQPFEPAEACRLILAIMPAFAYLHKLGLVYCDFKPQNVMLEELKDNSTTVKLIDLGTVIKYTKDPQAVYGTEGFYAPEAVKQPSPETDLYTICRSLAWMVSFMDLSKPQFGMPPAEHYKAFRDFPILYRFLQKGTNPVPARRYHSAEEMQDQLGGVLRIIAGGNINIPVTSKLFATGSMASTGKLGVKGMTALDEKDKALDLLRQGDAALKQGNNTSALGYYNQAVGVNPASSDAHLRLAEIYIDQQKYSEGLAEITKVQRLEPNNWKIAWYTGRLLEAQENLTAARDQYAELVQELPGELPPLLALARALAKIGDTRQAVDTYNLVIKADPANTEALFGASDALVKSKDYDGAASALTMVSDTSSKYVDAQMRICKLYLEEKTQKAPKDLAEVSTALRQLDTRNVDTPDLLLTKARFYTEAHYMAQANQLPNDFRLPTDSIDSGAASTQAPGPRRLGLLAEQNYQAYLERSPNIPNREELVRIKFKVAPWRLI
jgi:serine/threonine-protein kinase PknG